MELAGKQPICNMKKTIILALFGLFSCIVSAQSLWGGWSINCVSQGKDSLGRFSISEIRSFSVGNNSTHFSGPSGSLKTFLLPNANATILTNNAAVTIAQGGTGTGSTLTGLLLGGSSAFSAITSTTTGQIPRCTGANTFAFGALDLANSNAITGSLPYGNGGRDVVTGRSTGQTAAVASVATLTVGGSDASYTISGNVYVTTSSAENFTVSVDYTDENSNARNAVIPVLRASTGGVTTNIQSAFGAVPYPLLDIQIRCKASTSITIKTSGTFTGCTYNVEGSITRI